MNLYGLTATLVVHLFPKTMSHVAPPSDAHIQQGSERGHLWRALLATVVLFLLAISGLAYGQALPADTAVDELGITPYASYDGGDIDSISLTNGTVSLNLPILSYPQRGNLKLSFNLMYSNEPQHFNRVCNLHDPCEWNWDQPPYSKPLPSLDELGHVYVAWGQQVQAYGLTAPYKVGLYYWIPANWFIETADGSSHILGNLGNSSFALSQGQYVETQTGDFESLDATGWRMSGAQTTYDMEAENAASPSTVIIDPNGTRYTWSARSSTTQDSNGNLITSGTTSLTDSVGRSVPFPPTFQSAGNTSASGCTGPLTITKEVSWSPPSYNGGNAQYIFCYASVWPNMPGYGIYNGLPIYGYINVGTTLQSIVLPNGRTWTFEYNDPDTTLTYNGGPVTYGTLSKITLPTGGTISYTYTTVLQRSMACQNGGRWVHTRIVNANDGTGDHTWTYTYAFPIVTVTDPLSNDVVHTFTNIGSCDLYETERDYYQGTGGSRTLLKKIVTAYSYDTTSKNVYPKGSVNVVPIQVVTTWADGSSSQVTNTYDPGFSYLDYLGAIHDHGLYGKVSTEEDYDYSGSNPLRIINTTYQWQSNGAYGGTDNFINLVSQVQITDGTGSQAALTNYGYDQTAAQYSGIGTQHGSPHDLRGNLTSVARWRNLPTPKTLTTTMQNFDTGEAYTSTDPNGNTTTFTYDPYYAGSLLTKIQYPTTGSAQHIESFGYDLNTGVKTSFTDQNSQVTGYNYDEMDRLLSTSYPDGGSATYSYSDSPPNPSVTLTQTINSSQSKVRTAIVDGLGRLAHTQLSSDLEGVDYVDMTYDADGRKASVSNPYRSTTESTYGVTQYQYDALNRLQTQTQPDGSLFQYSYSGPTTTIRDEAGKVRKNHTDSLGRLTTVWEDPSGLNYETDYVYDCLSDLTSVNQQGINRSFSYDSLSRLYSATNPESGTTSYNYDDVGTLITKTDARGIVTTFTPDALRRITQKSYSNGDPTVHYCYDNIQTACGTSSVSNGIGRRTGMNDASGMTAWSYDSMGRVVTQPKTISGVSESISYQYNLDGSLWKATYPDSSVVQYSYSNAGRPTSVIDAVGGNNYGTSGTYTSSGALTQLVLANTTGFSGITLTNQYNKRLQPGVMSASTPSGTIFSLSYIFGLGANDNGNVNGITNNLDNTRSQTFTYDSLNRLSSAMSTPGGQYCWGDSYAIDRWGNLYQKNVTQCTAENLQFTVNNKNQLVGSGYTYDADGNMNLYNTFNAENEWTYQSYYGVTYLYDGDGRKVKVSGGSSGTKLYWYDEAGQVLAETDSRGNAVDNYVYFNGVSIAKLHIEPGPTYYSYYVRDHLGTTRMITDQVGNVCYDADYFPWGGEQHIYVNGCPPNYKFSGKERDPDTGSDYFGARFYKYTMARFYSPDPLLNSGRPGSPQTWNRYAYALNNPLRIVDPTGLYNVDCGSDKKCNKAAKDLKNGLSDLQKRVDKMKDGTQKTRLENALKAMGTENDKNNVNVSFGATKGGGAGETVPVSDPQTYKESFNVTLDPGKLNGSNDYAIAGAHEGTHVDDISSELANPSLGVLSYFSLEYRGYQTSAYAASALGQDSLSMNYDGKTSVIWNGSWGAVDKNITNFVTSFHDKNGKQDHPETTPHNPWPN